jgi:hypothetical protein
MKSARVVNPNKAKVFKVIYSYDMKYKNIDETSGLQIGHMVTDQRLSSSKVSTKFWNGSSK